jgi:HSP20 family molecular chaperone IbpA
MTLRLQATEDEQFSSMASNMSKWVDRVLGPNFHQYCPTEAWTPCVNLYEYPTHYCLVVDLSAVKVEDIDLRVDKGDLLISGHRESPGLPDASNSLRVLLMEIDHGKFCRRVQLPPDAEGDDIQQATYRNGCLWVRIPKRT